MDKLSQARDRLREALAAGSPYKWAAMLTADAVLGTYGFEQNGFIDCIVEGKDGWGSDPGGISFPNEIAESSGGEEAQYGFIEFECDAGPWGDPDWMDRVPFNEAFKLFDIAAKHYVDFYPDRREVVETKMRKASKTFDRLTARHKAWKRTNGVT